MWVLDGFRLTEVDGGPCLGLSSCLSRACGGGVDMGIWVRSSSILGDGVFYFG